MSIEARQITKRFGAFAALHNIDLEIPTGTLVALLGPSGSGKTTLLRIIAGLETPDSGEIFFDGENATDQSVRDRQVGFVFQHYALFRHMTVFENVAFGLRVRPRARRPLEAEIREKVSALLKLIQLEGLAARYPSQLSGGQRQRVALARALAVEPSVLLLDEPFGSLDARVRQELRRWLRRFHDELHVTSVFVTHDQEEALEVADIVVVMNEGRIEQVGTAEEVYSHPANPFVYHFLGNVNLFHGRAHEGRVQIGAVELDAPEHTETRNTPVVGYMRPHEIELDRTAVEPGMIAVVISQVHMVGPFVRLALTRQDGGGQLEAELPRERYQRLKFEKGEQVYIKLKNLRIFLQEKDAGDKPQPPPPST